ncbi:MAG: transposase [Verrucomicrobiota bacterium]
MGQNGVWEAVFTRLLTDPKNIYVMIDSTLVKARQHADCQSAPALLTDQTVKAVIADKGYDTNEICAFLRSQKMKAVIPAKCTHKHQHHNSMRSGIASKAVSADSSTIGASHRALWSQRLPLHKLSLPRLLNTLAQLHVDLP